MPRDIAWLSAGWTSRFTSRLLSACRRNKVLLVLVLILPAFRLGAIAYGLWLAPPGRFVPLLGDSWGGAEVIQQIKAGRAFPIGDPTNSTASLKVYPPGYFVLVAFASVTTGMSVPFAVQLVGLLIDVFLAFSFYLLCRRFLSRRGARFALLLLILPGSLVWLRTIPLLLDSGVASQIIAGIASGSTKLAIPQAIKDEITVILYGGHGALYDAMQMGYEWLAHALGLLSLLLFLSWRDSGGRARLFASGVMLGLVNLTHPYALFGWDLLFLCCLIYAAARRLREARALFALLAVAFMVSSFYVAPAGYSLLSGGSIRNTMSDVSGDLPWGMYNVRGDVRFPGPIRLLEVRGLSMIFAVAGIALAYCRGALRALWLPLSLSALGFLLSPMPVPFGVTNQLLARQEAFLFMGTPALAAYLLVEAFNRLRLNAHGSRLRRLVTRALILALVLLLFAPKVIGFSAYTLRWIPKSNLLDPGAASLIDALEDRPPGTIYAARDLSREIGALTQHVVPLGFVSTYTTRSWDQMQRSLEDESLVFEEDPSWERMAEILQKEGATLLVTDPSASQERLATLDANAAHLATVSGYRVYGLKWSA